ncbi:tannase/feruloyl esterase family alpha/beta hydrolase [Chondromyces apiculatus]|uniref:tannase/feruloyl esterase family alpha/beta hydrolase n=1 Tax=Chondromyces apiculatus TaxID=51 RepID=UPI0005C67B0A|nr:tannase/feruloyl esterase family alpha/beta hydrolase [Chondromyces apiculatus]
MNTRHSSLCLGFLGRALVVSTAALLASGCGGTDEPGPAGETNACSALQGKTFGEGTVEAAETVEAADGGGATCRVTGLIRTSLRFEAHLPEQWNKKLVFGGGGGFDGFIYPVLYSPSANSGGYVRVFSNGGHEADPEAAAGDASFALNNPEAREDFAYRSSHRTLEVVKQIVQTHYGEAPARSYFEGCSNGGREALMQAVHYPEDYDGIVSRAPAYDFTHLIMAFVNNARHTHWTPGGALDAAALKTLTDAVLAECDALDGLEDGTVSDVSACTFDPETLRCAAGGNGEGCLTDAQVETVSAVYGPTMIGSRDVYPGWGPGGESDPVGWAFWLGTNAEEPSFQLALAEGLVKYWLLEDPAYEVASFVPEEHEARIDAAAAQLDAAPDLGAYFSRGGKLVMAHGTTDWAISYKSSIDYFDAVAGAVGGAASRDASMEFFLQPGVQHCGGGSGADTDDLLAAVDAWVEKEQLPSAQGLVAEKIAESGEVTMRRPLCKYPAFPRYDGSGDPNAAESFTCVDP